LWWFQIEKVMHRYISGEIYGNFFWIKIYLGILPKANLFFISNLFTFIMFLMNKQIKYTTNKCKINNSDMQKIFHVLGNKQKQNETPWNMAQVHNSCLRNAHWIWICNFYNKTSRKIAKL
jgi:hypothetical protein